MFSKAHPFFRLKPCLIILASLFIFGCGQAALSHKMNKIGDTYANRLQMDTPNVEPIEVGKAFTFQLDATMGTPPYKWELFDSQLPPGLILDESSGVISGTPEKESQETIIVKLSDSSGNANDYIFKSFVLVAKNVEVDNEANN